MNYEWKKLEAKTPDKRERSCWINSEGRWYNCPFADHPIFAEAVLKTLYNEDIGIGPIMDFGFRLIKKGWILVHHDWSIGTVIQNGNNMTLEQYKVLKEFFNDEPLFRGWTIDALWKAKKNTVELEVSKDE